VEGNPLTTVAASPYFGFSAFSFLRAAPLQALASLGLCMLDAGGSQQQVKYNFAQLWETWHIFLGHWWHLELTF
jgi:hypothetical protein